MVMEKSVSLDEIEEQLRNRPLYRKIWHAIKYPVLRWLDFPYHFKRVKWFIQRGSRGYADCDWWALSYNLTKVILPMLKQMREHSMSYPGYGQASTPEKWDALFDEMIEGFELAIRIDDYNFETPDQIKVDVKIFEKKMKVFIKWYFHLWD